MNAEVDSDAEGAKKKKAPNMSRLLKTRLQKLVAKSDDEYVIMWHMPPCVVLNASLADAYYQRSSWNSPTRSSGQYTTSSSRSRNASRMSS